MTAVWVAAAAGAVAGALLAWLVATLRHQAATSALRARMEERDRMAAERAGALEQAEHRLRDAFEAVSADALRQNAASFLQLAQTALGEQQRAAAGELEARQRAVGDLVAPIREALTTMDGKLHQVELARVGSYESLLEQVRTMADTQRELTGRTRQLVDALRAPQVRGRWGEIQLRRVCEMAGMLDHCDFVEQSSVDGADGRLRPDLKVRLPGGKIIIVDAKAPLQAYLAAVEAPDDATRDRHLADHARQVRDHVGKLAAKSYWSQFAETPEFVVMFLPGETFFSAALQHDPSLIEHGVDQRVIPSSPTTLIALLRSVAYGWQQERIARNAEEISGAGRELYERLRAFAGHYVELRRSLGRAVDSYNRSVGSLERSVLPQARRFRDLGATSAAELEDPGAVETTLRTLGGADVRAGELGAVLSLPDEGERPVA